MKILVVGPGGTGQTFLIGELNKSGIETNDIADKDGHKHKKYNKSISDRYDKVIYVYGDIFSSICSHFRRDWVMTQLSKMNPNHNVKSKDIHTYLKDVGENKIDQFKYYDHLKSWYDNRKKNIYFLNFENPDFKKLSGFIGDDFKYNIIKRNNYSELKNKYKEAYRFYSNLYVEYENVIKGL